MTDKTTKTTEEEEATTSRRNLFAGALGTAVVAGAVLGSSKAAQATVDSSKSKLQQVLSRGVLRVGTGSTNPPWHFEDDTGKLVGMDIDMARLIAKSLFDDPTKVEFVIQGSDARIPSLITDKVDVICQWMTITAGRAQQVEFTVPYYREGVGLLVMADNPKYKKFDDLMMAGDSVKVGAMQNVFIEEWIHKGLPQAKVDQFDSPDTTLQALNAGRVDAYLGDQSAIRWLMNQFPGRYADSGYGWLPNSYASAVRPGDPVWLNWVNTVYREALMGVDFDTMKASYKKWFGIDVATPKVGFPGEFQ
ncbi:extracellular solute-binding protein, family 3 [alpha proteobacterium BAL199]|jgi:polar amino acid transport system substrate-binding protein|nr:extracellular solute-binding protein, family 3 [alpha proteobacterium BAL199]